MKQTSPAARNAIASMQLKRQPYYCEENAWHLCQESFFEERARHVVFISNDESAVPMWNQRAGRGKPIVWDYHVIVLAENPIEIWDMDTTLGMPLTLHDYLAGSFHPEMPEMYQPRFRIVQASIFIDIFASDRGHMRRPDGSFRKAPPPWPCIGKPGVASNLMHFIDMGHAFVGEVLSLDELRDRFDMAHSGTG